MIKEIIQDEQGTIWEVPSSSSNEKYVVAIDENNLLFCSCPDFIFRKVQGRIGVPLGDTESYCKHICECLENSNISSGVGG